MSEQITIGIVNIVGDGICVSSDDGEKVYETVLSILKLGNGVLISFAGVEDLTTVFLNAAIGQLYGQFSEEEIRARLSVIDASSQDLETLKHCIDRAKEYFKDADRFVSSANKVLGVDDDNNS